MKCILCSMWKNFRWTEIRHTGQWIYQQNAKGERRIVKGPKRGDEVPDEQWKQTGVFKK